MFLIFFLLGSEPGLALRSGTLPMTAAGNTLLQKRQEPHVGVAVFETNLSDRQKETLKQHAALLAPLSANSYLVHWYSGVQKVPGLKWTGDLPSHLKTIGSPQFARPYHLLISPCIDAYAWCQKNRIHADSIVGNPQFSLIRISNLDADTWSHIQADPFLFWLEPYQPKRLLNDRSVWVCQAGLNNMTTPVHDQGILGQNQIVAVMDTGLDADHCMFFDSTNGLPNGTLNLSQRKVVAYMDLGMEGNWDSQGHGTHVAGSIAGDNIPYDQHNNFDGMAPSAKLIIQDGGYMIDDFADLPFLPADYYNDLFLPTYTMGARIHSNSWGAHENFGTNNYTVECQMCDQFIWDHPDFSIFFAAGNEGHNGPPSMTDPATAKNLIAVGATGGGNSASGMASFSSNGPVQDGRMKPDLTAPGAGIHSAQNDNNINSMNCGQATLSGTSMACPTAAGLAALVRQYYVDGFYPSGTANGPDAFTPSAALIKATLLASGTPMEAMSEFPSNIQGYGRITLDQVLYFAGDNESLWTYEHTGLQTATSYMVNINVAEHQEVKVFLVWSDYPSTPIASTNLVNDLDLSLSGPSGSFIGNNWVNGVSQTGGSPDRINNVEMIRLIDPQSGNYSLMVNGFAVPEGPQPFALVILQRPVPQTITVLSETNQTATMGQDLFFQWEIPADVLSMQVRSSGGTGDADLYVRFGAQPSTSIFDFKSDGSTSNESVVVSNPQAGTWHALLHAFSTFSGVSFEVTYQIPYTSSCLTYQELLDSWPTHSVLVLVDALTTCPSN
ncbi:MAG: S8 family serine peptidase [Acidobacteria bacterium]|nr:S8 family serine peptidase [Acidobacteriota bacterium]MCB9397086.1 S8 family serine peptidase [Acidobacteriota bacterium]